ncbi:MAG: hypothetical protein QM484_14330 [Woeseiaceae bacterium]
MSTDITYTGKAKHEGNNNIYQAPLTSLEKAIEQIKIVWSTDEKMVDIIEELAGYITDHPARKIIGLEKKLEKGDRNELIDNAILLKNRFERRIAKNQMSMSEQHVYIQVLSAINTSWLYNIRPLIESGENNIVVDQAILKELIEPVHKAIVSYDYTMSTDLVSGMLYFLTGKCHLIWESKC